ncbi:MAG: hypothetical protein ABIN01_09110 [Ferruginibacter sp.]
MKALLLTILVIFIIFICLYFTKTSSNAEYKVPSHDPSEYFQGKWVEVMDAEGRETKQSKYNDSIRITLLDNGYYFAEIRFPESEKFIPIYFGSGMYQKIGRFMLSSLGSAPNLYLPMSEEEPQYLHASQYGYFRKVD